MNKEKFAKAAGISAGLAARWFPHFIAAMEEFGIVNPLDQAMFIAQTGHESTGFKRLRESFDYSVKGLAGFIEAGRITRDQAQMLGRKDDEDYLPPERQRAIANLVLQHRYGNTAPTDGWKYRGRGLIQITFKDNYRTCGRALKTDLVLCPELLEQDEYAARSAAWFFVSNGCLSHTGNTRKITRIINGGHNGFDDRLTRYNKAKDVLTKGES
jgi:putative chitinase